MHKLIALVAVAIVIAGCNNTNTERDDTQRVQDQQSQYAKVQPIPFFDFSMDRDTLVQIYKAKNESRRTWSVVQSQGTGTTLFICESIGFAIPADTQLTNPLQVIRGPWGGEGQIVEQPEPNGLYSSKNTDGTYVQCVGPGGDVSPVYTEHKVTTFPFPVTVDANGLVTRAPGDATITIDVKSGTEGEAPLATQTP